MHNILVSVGWDGRQFIVRHGRDEYIIGMDADVYRAATDAWHFPDHFSAERFVDGELAYDDALWSEAARCQAERERAVALWNERVAAGIAAVPLQDVFALDMSAHPEPEFRAIIETILHASDKVVYTREVPVRDT